MRDVGSVWETVVENHLRVAGLKTLARNFYCRYGEIDLIMRERDCIVFVEVRYRRSRIRGDGVASVGMTKRKKLTQTASMFLQSRPALGDLPCRFDVIGCSGTPQQPEFDWARGAFEAF
ncbi:MAG: YraN family protein [Rudaea sp.]